MRQCSRLRKLQSYPFYCLCVRLLSSLIRLLALALAWLCFHARERANALIEQYLVLKIRMLNCRKYEEIYGNMRAQMMESFQNGVTKHNQYSKWNRKNNHSVKKMSKRYKIVIASVNYNFVHEKPFMIFGRFKRHTIGAF